MATSRNYGIDMFRILSMFMVITLHVLKQGGILDAAVGIPFHYEIAWLLETACYGAVNGFALISGYVGLNAKHRYTNLIVLWLQVLVISVALLGVQYALDPSSFSLATTISAALPPFTKKYWYFTAYTILFFFMPLLNAAIHSLDKRTLRNALMVLTAFHCLSSIVPGPEFEDDPFWLHNGYCAMWLINLYLIGGYMAKYQPFGCLKRRYGLLIYLVGTVLAFGSKIALEHAPQTIQTHVPPNTFINYTSPLILVSSVALLSAFAKTPTLPRPMTAMVKYVSPLCFGIYIIHLHPLIWSKLDDLFAPFASFPLPLMSAAILAAVIGIFVLCLLIETVRFYLFKWLKIKDCVSAVESKLSA